MAITEDLGLEIDLSNEQFGRGVPYEAFARLRRHAPLYWYAPGEYWVVSSYELLGTINRDPARFSSWGGPGPAGSTANNPGAQRGLTILTMDPPQHGTYRRLVNSSFNPRHVNAQEETVRRLAREVVDDFVAQGGGDFITEVASLFPLRVISALMGIDREDEAAIIRRTNAILGGTDPEYAPASPDEAAAFGQAMVDHADRLLEEHRRHPRGDLVDELLDARVDGEPLTEEELRAWVIMYIGGGAETTRHLIGHGLVALLEWPGECRKVVDGADMVPVVEEMLRYVTPVMQHARWPLEAVEIGDHRILPGQRTTLWMVSANRDEAAFEDPDRFDVSRDPNRHDSLGAGGPHFCLGAGYARLEARVIFEELRPHLDRMGMTGPPERGQHTMFNILKHLPIEVR